MTTPDAPPMVLDRRHTVLDSPIGPLTVVGGPTDDGFAVSGIYFTGHSHPPAPGSLGRPVGARGTGFDALHHQLAEYFDGGRTAFDVTLAPAGSAFQHRVWALLRTIPYGTTRSYGELAADLGDVRLARAVGTANARNPLSIVVPCHRVVGAAGSLTGYAGGMERKAFLLAVERRADALF